MKLLKLLICHSISLLGFLLSWRKSSFQGEKRSAKIWLVIISLLFNQLLGLLNFICTVSLKYKNIQIQMHFFCSILWCIHSTFSWDTNNIVTTPISMNDPLPLCHVWVAGRTTLLPGTSVKYSHLSHGFYALKIFSITQVEI